MRKKRLKIYSSTFLATMILVNMNVAHAEKDDWKPHAVSKCDDTTGQGKDGNSIQPSGGANEDVYTEGSEANKMAHKLFDIFTKEYGWSGAAAAGALANSWRESRLIPDIGEGGKRFGMNNPDGSSYNSAKPNEQGGGGLFQFTGYSRFSHSRHWKLVNKDEGWSPENQVSCLWYDYGFADKSIIRTGKGREGIYNKTFPFNSMDEWLSSDDPVKSQAAFQIGFEGGQVYHSESDEVAKMMNAYFNKDNIKADPSKWKFSDNENTNDMIDGSHSVSTIKDRMKCKDKKSSGNGGWEGDHTGTYPFARHDTMWGRDELPEELHKYMIFPDKIGMHWESPEGWSYNQEGGYCNHLASSMLNAAWVKKGTHERGPSLNGGETGYLEARRAAELLGGDYSLEPHKGSLVALPRGGHHSSIELGHVAFVAHVFENGDLLVVEQNSPKSGHWIGGRWQWNYFFMPVEVWKSDKWEFYNPGEHGYEPNPEYFSNAGSQSTSDDKK